MVAQFVQYVFEVFFHLVRFILHRSNWFDVNFWLETINFVKENCLLMLNEKLNWNSVDFTDINKAELDGTCDVADSSIRKDTIYRCCTLYCTCLTSKFIRSNLVLKQENFLFFYFLQSLNSLGYWYGCWIFKRVKKSKQINININKCQ